MRLTKEVILSLLFAGVATVLVLCMILLEHPASTSISLNEKMVVSGVFITSCCVGITLALYPGWIRNLIRKKIRTAHGTNERPKRSFHGHHPDCDMFQTHRITVNTKTWCAGCLGLLIGSLVSIVFMLMYVLFPIHQSPLIFFMLFLLGLFLIALIFIEIVEGSKHVVAHILFNAMLAPSFFFITMSVTELTGKSIFGVFTILLCALWLSTRVTLSTWRHRLTCSSCRESCKMYAPFATSVERSL